MRPNFLSTSPENNPSPHNSLHKQGLLGVAALAILAVTACSGKSDTVQESSQPVIEEIIVTEVWTERDGATVLGKTDYAEVIRVDLPAGEFIPPHNGGDRLILNLSDYKIAFEKPGEVDFKSFEKGDVHYHPAGVHEIYNDGDSAAAFLIFERLKAGNLPEGGPTTDEGDTPTPEANATEVSLFSNASFDAYEVLIEPGGKLAPHKGYARAIYSYDDYNIEFHENGKTKKRTFSAGEVHFHNPGTHWLKNVGDSSADFVVVDFKK